MESKTLYEAMKSRELILKLLDAVNSAEEFAYLEGELTDLAAALTVPPSRSPSERRWN